VAFAGSVSVRREKLIGAFLRSPLRLLRGRAAVVTVAVALLVVAVGYFGVQRDPGAIPAETKLRPTVLAQIPHDPSAFTEGFELDGSNLYESTGLIGQSQLREFAPATYAPRRAVDPAPSSEETSQ
jgi:glutaminyl-peptide cyclotransferase